MKLFTAIFIRYFAVFFAIFFALVAFWQLRNAESIDYYFTFLFPAVIAIIGATIAAVAIRIFKKLEAVPPWVQPNEYVVTDSKIINGSLLKLRRNRILLFIMFCMFIPYGISIMALKLTNLLIMLYMLAIAILAFTIQFFRCPRCGHYFQFRGVRSGEVGDIGNETLNLLFGGGYRNSVTGKCLNCGLSIFASNKSPS